MAHHLAQLLIHPPVHLPGEYNIVLGPGVSEAAPADQVAAGGVLPQDVVGRIALRH